MKCANPFYSLGNHNFESKECVECDIIYRNIKKYVCIDKLITSVVHEHVYILNILIFMHAKCFNLSREYIINSAAFTSPERSENPLELYRCIFHTNL